MLILCAALALAAWTLMEGTTGDLISLEVLRDRWMDMLDPAPAEEYVREKMPVIGRIAEIMYRSFGPNG